MVMVLVSTDKATVYALLLVSLDTESCKYLHVICCLLFIFIVTKCSVVESYIVSVRCLKRVGKAKTKSNLCLFSFKQR